jgi:ADP-L-glycero-D-manno-heptose 6-epimerase
MIVITGAAGFIASCLVAKFNQMGRQDLLLVDDFNRPEKARNLEGKSWAQKIDRQIFPKWLHENGVQVSFVYHLGARTDTTEFDRDLLNALNLDYSKAIFHSCAQYNIPLVYASSAATYGMGEFGFEDRDELAYQLVPLNPYGESKNDFDRWILEQKQHPDHWRGIKFFNVYGPNEFHKNRMASVVFHTFNQVRETGKMRLFRSHHPDYRDGEQLRDFIYVKDVIDVLYFMMDGKGPNGLYNLGTGKARSFLDLAKATFQALGQVPNIEFVDTPLDIRDKYQYFTEAKMDKLRAIGYHQPFTTLEEGIGDYVRQYLVPDRCF